MYHNLFAHSNRIEWGRVRVEHQRQRWEEWAQNQYGTYTHTHTEMECSQDTCDNVHRMKHKVMVTSVYVYILFDEFPTETVHQRREIGAHCEMLTFSLLSSTSSINSDLFIRNSCPMPFFYHLQCNTNFQCHSDSTPCLHFLWNNIVCLAFSLQFHCITDIVYMYKLMLSRHGFAHTHWCITRTHIAYKYFVRFNFFRLKDLWFVRMAAHYLMVFGWNEEKKKTLSLWYVYFCRPLATR